MNQYEQYVRQQFKKLQPSVFGYSVKIFDANGNSTNQMELTPQKVELILKVLKEVKQ